MTIGFTTVFGPEIEWDEINFQKLLLGPNHPSRDTQETYYFDKKNNVLLRFKFVRDSCLTDSDYPCPQSLFSNCVNSQSIGVIILLETITFSNTFIINKVRVAIISGGLVSQTSVERAHLNIDTMRGEFLTN